MYFRVGVDDNSDEHSNSDTEDQAGEESEGNEPEEFGMRQNSSDFEGTNCSSTSGIDITRSTACDGSGPSVSGGDSSDNITLGTDEKQGECATAIMLGSVSTSQSQVVDMKESEECVNNKTTSGGAEVRLECVEALELDQAL